MEQAIIDAIKAERAKIADRLLASIPRDRWYDGGASRMVKKMVREIAEDIRSGNL